MTDLSPTQQRILELLKRGHSEEEIASFLHLSPQLVARAVPIIAARAEITRSKGGSRQ